MQTVYEAKGASPKSELILLARQKVLGNRSCHVIVYFALFSLYTFEFVLFRFLNFVLFCTKVYLFVRMPFVPDMILSFLEFVGMLCPSHDHDSIVLLCILSSVVGIAVFKQPVCILLG